MSKRLSKQISEEEFKAILEAKANKLEPYSTTTIGAGASKPPSHRPSTSSFSGESGRQFILENPSELRGKLRPTGSSFVSRQSPPKRRPSPAKRSRSRSPIKSTIKEMSTTIPTLPLKQWTKTRVSISTPSEISIARKPSPQKKKSRSRSKSPRIKHPRKVSFNILPPTLQEPTPYAAIDKLSYDEYKNKKITPVVLNYPKKVIEYRNLEDPKYGHIYIKSSRPPANTYLHVIGDDGEEGFFSKDYVVSYLPRDPSPPRLLKSKKIQRKSLKRRVKQYRRFL